MGHYIALTHKEADSSYRVSFPDVPGITATADPLENALTGAAEALAFAFEDWQGKLLLPQPLDTIRFDRSFLERSSDAVIAKIWVNGELS